MSRHGIPGLADHLQSFAQSQIDYLMGKNPMNCSSSLSTLSTLTDLNSAVYLVGSHPNSPQNPHSAAAAGGTNISTIRTDPETEAHVLYGAMVGGPLYTDKFWDYRDDWVQNEVALDYNAMIPTLAAMQVSRRPLVV